jgi:4-hydroxy-tetrahydrodipicolinate synthase
MLKGILVAMATPFSASGEEVDEQALAQLVEELIRDGVHGIVVCGSTGEFFTMTKEERKRVLAVTVETARRRVPIIAHTAALATSDAVELSKHAERAGAEVLMVVPSFYEPLTRREVVSYYKRISEASRLPIMLYNIPSACSTDVTPDMIAEITAVANVPYVKDSTGDLHRIYQIQWATGGKVTPISGSDTMAFQALAWGTTAAVWGAANVTTRECVALYELLVVKKDLAKAAQLWERLLPVQHFLETAGYIAAVKAGAELRGRKVGAPRAPILPLAEGDRTELKRLLDELAAVEPLVNEALRA